MRRRAVNLSTRAGLALAASAALMSTTGLAPAAAATPLATRHLDLAGYHFTVSKKTASLTVKADIKVPTVSCGSGSFAFAPQVVVHYLIGTGVQTASAAVGLDCISGLPVYAPPILLVGSHTVNGSRAVTPGETVAITITITRSAATVKMVYSTTVTDSGKGGPPTDVQDSMVLVNPPKYTPVNFTQCTTNGKSLASFKPGAWEAVNKSGKVTGIPSKISNGTSFTITE